jgi:hypothetical protein
MRYWAIAGMLLSTGCMTASFTSGKLPAPEVKTERGEFYLYGLVGEKTVDLSALCPGGVASFHEQLTLSDVLLQVVTCGIYCPTTIEVRCASGTSYQLAPQATADRTLVIPMTGSPRR